MPLPWPGGRSPCGWSRPRGGRRRGSTRRCPGQTWPGAGNRRGRRPGPPKSRGPLRSGPRGLSCPRRRLAFPIRGITRSVGQAAASGSTAVSGGGRVPASEKGERLGSNARGIVAVNNPERAQAGRTNARGLALGGAWGCSAVRPRPATSRPGAAPDREVRFAFPYRPISSPQTKPTRRPAAAPARPGPLGAAGRRRARP